MSASEGQGGKRVVRCGFWKPLISNPKVENIPPPPPPLKRDLIFRVWWRFAFSFFCIVVSIGKIVTGDLRKSGAVKEENSE